MNRYGLINVNGQIVTKRTYDYLPASPSCGLVAFREPMTRLWGYMTVSEEIVIPPQFNDAFPFSPTTALARVVKTKDETRFNGAINTTGELILPCEHQFVHCDGETLIRCSTYETHGLFGYKSVRNEWVIKPTLDYSTDFIEGLAAISRADEDESFLIGIDGKPVLGPFRGVGPMRGGLARCELKPNTKAVISRSGATLFEISEEDFDFGEFCCGLAPAVRFRIGIKDGVPMRVGDWGYMDAKGKIIVPFKYESTFSFHSSGYAKCHIPNGWDLLNATGKKVIPSNHVYVSIPSNGRIAFGEELPGKPLGIGFLDISGNVAIPPRFKNASDFSEGYAAVQFSED